MAVSWINAGDLPMPQSPYAVSAAATASWILYKLTAEKYPGVSSSDDWYSSDPNSPHLAHLISNGGTNSQSRHYNIYEIGDHTSPKLWLRSRPVVSVETVSVNGRVLDPEEYFIGNRAFLSLTSGERWDYTAGVFVRYTHGILPPEAGLRAAERLAHELVLSIEDPEQCTLPDRVSAVTRQGLSFEILQPTDFIENSRTGIYEVDLFIQAANPTRAKKPPKVYSPDIPSGIRRT